MLLLHVLHVSFEVGFEVELLRNCVHAGLLHIFDDASHFSLFLHLLDGEAIVVLLQLLVALQESRVLIALPLLLDLVIFAQLLNLGLVLLAYFDHSLSEGLLIRLLQRCLIIRQC